MRLAIECECGYRAGIPNIHTDEIAEFRRKLEDSGFMIETPVIKDGKKLIELPIRCRCQRFIRLRCD